MQPMGPHYKGKKILCHGTYKVNSLSELSNWHQHFYYLLKGMGGGVGTVMSVGWGRNVFTG